MVFPGLARVNRPRPLNAKKPSEGSNGKDAQTNKLRKHRGEKRSLPKRRNVLFTSGIACASGTLASTPAGGEDDWVAMANAETVQGIKTGSTCTTYSRTRSEYLQDVPLTSRQSFNLEGLIPPAETTHDVEIERLKAIVDSTEGRLDKYRFLMTLKEANVHAYMSILQKYPKDIIPLIYTPTVADACENFGLLLVKPIGLYVGLQHKGRIRDLLNQWPSNEVQIVVVTDGERVLGLGDLGVHGMGIVAGKTDIYNAYGGVSPRNVMPVALDVGCNKKDYRENKFYLGSNQERIRGDQYTEFVDEFIEAVCDKFGRDTLFHFEDFGSKNAPVLLKRYQDKGKNVFNDDIQATSVVCLTSILGATHQKGVADIKEQKFLFYGAGQANVGGANLLLSYLTEKEGMDRAEAMSRIFLFDSKGVVTEDRKELSDQKLPFAKPASFATASLADAVRAIKPSALIGAASVPRSFNKEIITAMAEYNKRPLILSLSNPLTKTECTANECYEWSGGRAIYAAGTYNEVTNAPKGHATSLVNNALVFPSIGRGARLSPPVTVNKLLAVAAQLSNLLTEEEIEEGLILPDVSRIQSLQKSLTKAFVECSGPKYPIAEETFKYSPFSCYKTVMNADKKYQ